MQTLGVCNLEELKSLSRYRFDKVRQRAKLKQSVSRLVTILFPKLEKLVPTLHIASVYALPSELLGAKQVASCHLTHLASSYPPLTKVIMLVFLLSLTSRAN